MSKKILVVIPICLDSEIPLLKLCISQIERYSSFSKNKIDYLVMNQTGSELKTSDWVRVENCQKIDGGYPLDKALCIAEAVTYDYFVSLDVDAFPIKSDWIDKYIEMFTYNNFLIQVGVDTDLSHSYKRFGEFTHLNNYFRIMPMYKALDYSQVYGFRRPISQFADNGVMVSIAIAKDNIEKPWIHKYNIGIPKAVGCTPGYGLYGFTLGDSVFHFSFGSTCEIDFPDKAKQLEILGQEYLDFMGEVRNWKGSLDDLADWLVSQLKDNVWRTQFNKKGIIPC